MKSAEKILDKAEAEYAKRLGWTPAKRILWARSAIAARNHLAETGEEFAQVLADRNLLLEHCGALGADLLGSEYGRGNESFRALPERLQRAVNEATEKAEKGA